MRCTCRLCRDMWGLNETQAVWEYVGAVLKYQRRLEGEQLIMHAW